MILPVLRRDRAPGRFGAVSAIAGPLLLTLLVGGLARFVYANETMVDIVLIFGINAVMVVGFQVFVGNTGLVSFGHLSFMAIGAYATALASMSTEDKSFTLMELPTALANFQVGAVESLLIGGLVAGFFALVAGFALMRLSGSAASIATLGLLSITLNVLSQAHSLTNGPQSLFGVPDKTNFKLVFGSLLFAVLVSGLFKWSRSGLRARANRDDPAAAESSGVSSMRARLIPFVLSGFLTGIGGGLYAMLLTAFSPASFAIPLAVVVLTMAIIGGINSISGALVGSVLVTLLNELLRKVEDGVTLFNRDIIAPTGISSAVLGVALIIALRLRPEGLLSALELQVEQRRNRG